MGQNRPQHIYCFLNGCQRQFKAKWLDEKWLTYSASEDGGFCVPCALFQRSRGQDVGQLITKPMTNWTRDSTTLKGHAVSKTHRVLGTLHSCKTKTPALPSSAVVAAQNDHVISANNRKLSSILDCIVFWFMSQVGLKERTAWCKRDDWTWLNRQGLPETFDQDRSKFAHFRHNLQKIFRGQAPVPHLLKIEPPSVPLGLRPWNSKLWWQKKIWKRSHPSVQRRVTLCLKRGRNAKFGSLGILGRDQGRTPQRTPVSAQLGYTTCIRGNHRRLKRRY